MQADERTRQPDRILVIDDRADTRYLLSRVLNRAGFEVQEASTGEEGLRLAATLPALAILDINLPDMSGIEVCRRIKSDPATASVMVIHLSANFISSEDQVHGLSVGADGYLTHPVEPEVLVARLQAFLRLRRAEEGLRQAKAELERIVELRTQDIESLKRERDLRERFVATLTHDLRSPLAAARISAELLLRSRVDDSGRVRAAQRILRSVDRTDRMIQDLLDATRIRAGQAVFLAFEEVDLGELVGAVADELETVHGKKVQVRAGDGAGPGPHAKVDADALRRVLENLVTNAFKYGSQADPVAVEVEARGAWIDIRVRNLGEPIPAEEIPLLFEPFRRASTAQTVSEKGVPFKGKPGWGLGLTLVRGIAEAHGGSVEVVSARETGTVFTVRLPVTPPEPGSG